MRHHDDVTWNHGECFDVLTFPFVKTFLTLCDEDKWQWHKLKKHFNLYSGRFKDFLLLVIWFRRNCMNTDEIFSFRAARHQMKRENNFQTRIFYTLWLFFKGKTSYVLNELSIRGTFYIFDDGFPAVAKKCILSFLHSTPFVSFSFLFCLRRLQFAQSHENMH